jgi:hypothetical protein
VQKLFSKYFSVNTQTMHIYSNHTRQHCSISPKNLTLAGFEPGSCAPEADAMSELFGNLASLAEVRSWPTPCFHFFGGQLKKNSRSKKMNHRRRNGCQIFLVPIYQNYF